MARPRSTSDSPTASTPEQVAQDPDERESDAGRQENVQLEQETPSSTGAVYEGSVVVEESKHPDFS
jgi:hypothetical protein